jgi:hypothetical protein
MHLARLLFEVRSRDCNLLLATREDFAAGQIECRNAPPRRPLCIADTGPRKTSPNRNMRIDTRATLVAT